MAEQKIVQRETAITDQEYQFPDNIAEERLKAVLTARRILRDDKIRYQKEDLIRFFRKYLQPLPQRSTQLRRCNALRLTGKFSLQKTRLMGSGSTDDVKDKNNTCGHDSKCTTKPVKLKRQHGNGVSGPPRQSKELMRGSHKQLEESDAKESRQLTVECDAGLIDKTQISHNHGNTSKKHSLQEIASSYRHSSEHSMCDKEHNNSKFNTCSSHSDKDRQIDTVCQPVEAEHHLNQAKRKSTCVDSNVLSDKGEGTGSKKKKKIPKITWP